MQPTPEPIRIVLLPVLQNQKNMQQSQQDTNKNITAALSTTVAVTKPVENKDLPKMDVSFGGAGAGVPAAVA